MRKFLRIVFIVLMFIFGISALRIEFGRQEFGLVDDVKKIPFITLCLLAILSFVLDVKAFKTRKTLFQFTPTFIGLFLLSLIFYKKIVRHKIYSQLTVLKVVNQAGAKNVLQFDFKEGNNFILTETHLLGSEVYYGKYEKNNDTIFILSNPYNGLIKTMPKYGIISHDTMFWFRFDIMLIEK